MFLVIKNEDSNIDILNTSEYIIIEDFCKVKNYVKDNYYIIILLDTNITEEGLLENYNYFFEEILITLDIKAIISNTNNEKLKEITKFYSIPYINL